MKRALVLIAALIPAAACVSTQKFKDQEAAAAAQKTRADGLDAELEKTKKSLADLQAAQAAASEASLKTIADLNSQIKAGGEQLASASIQLDSVQKSNKDLQSSLEANKGELSKKVSDLVKQKDDLSKQLNDASNQATDLRRQLAATQEEKRRLEQAKAEELAKVKANYEQLTAGLQSEISAGQVTITQLKGKLTLNMVDKILFDSGKAEIKDDGKKVLEKVGTALNTMQEKDIRIEGHTDNKPIVGDLRDKYPTNWELSTARATSVARYLEDHAKVDAKRLVAAGYGEYHPVAANDTPENRALNRRIEIILVPRD